MHRLLIVCYYITTLFFVTSDGYKILLVFPFPTKSHTNLGNGFVRHLLKAGHEVTYVTPAPKRESHSNLRHVNVSDNYNVMPGWFPWSVWCATAILNCQLMQAFLNIEAIMSKQFVLDEFGVFNLCHALHVNTLKQKELQDLMLDANTKFDIVIAEWMFSELFSGLASVYDCPIIWSSSLDSHWLVRRIMDGITNPAFTADYTSTNIPPFTFAQRVEELWLQIKVSWFLKYTIEPQAKEIFEQVYGPAMEKRGRRLPTYGEAAHNGSLFLLNSHVSFGQPNTMPHNFKYIGGYHIDTPIKPLTQDIQKIMDDSKDGVIYFSMGSVLRSQDMPSELKIGLLNMFSELKYTVLWKFEEILQDVPKNVHILKWAPQQSILAHAKCVLFITHGGLLSTTEAIHSGVPLIGIPMFADQFNNIDRAVAKGIAKRVDLTYNTPAHLKEAINDMLNNRSYRDTINRMTAIYHDRPLSPGAELVYWVEHVVRTRGAPHLRSPAFMASWYQKMYLDLLALIVVVVALSILFIKQFVLPFLHTKNVEDFKKYK